MTSPCEAGPLDLYDSDTGVSLVASHSVNASQDAERPMYLVYTSAKRGNIVQIQEGSGCIHYFYEEPIVENMIRQDAKRWGLTGDALLAAIKRHAPQADVR